MLIVAGLFFSCENERFIDDIYVEPSAAFSITEKTVFDVFESVKFTNQGEGQKFAVWPGDSLHVYGKKEDYGFACNTDGTFSYSYQEPGEYTAVWVASSIKANGEVVMKTDSTKIKVEALGGGLEKFTIRRIARLREFGSAFFYDSYGEFVEDNRIVCPMPYELWTRAASTLTVKFILESDFAKLLWESADGDVQLASESTNKIFTFGNEGKLAPQTINVRTSSGSDYKYEVAAMVIPEFTAFTVSGVDSVRTRDLSGFNKFEMVIDMPSESNLAALTPTFTVMNDDANLIDSQKIVSVTANGVEQTSGTTVVDFTNPVDYTIKYSVPGSNGYTYTYESHYIITVKHKD